jgi:hypothetical protein
LKDELASAQRDADAKAREIAELERESARDR